MISPTFAPTTHNGLLLYVPGEAVSAGSDTLPPPSELENHTPERKVVVDVPRMGGRVRITYRLKKYRHYKSSYWRWSAEWADAVDAAQG